MKIRVHYEKDGIEDYYDIEDDSDQLIKIIALNINEMKKRGLDEIKNNCWSEEL